MAPESKIVYVDNDPLVLAHARALLTSAPEGATEYLDADIRNPAAILDAAGLLDLKQPIAPRGFCLSRASSSAIRSRARDSSVRVCASAATASASSARSDTTSPAGTSYDGGPPSPGTPGPYAPRTLTARICRQLAPKRRSAGQNPAATGASSGIITDVNDDWRLAVTFGPDQPQRFLTAWLGPPSRNAPDSAASDLPAALAHWHRQAGRWDPPVMRQNRLPASRETDADMLLVAVENQAVWLWGVRNSGGNPLVWERENEPGAGWTQTGERLDEFLWHFTLVEAVLGGHFGLGADDVSPADLTRFTNAWTALPVKPWRWPGPDQALWTRDGLLAWTMVNDRPDSPVTDASTCSIFVGARSNQDLIQVDDTGITWDWDSRNEP